ncbi:MAG: glycosyltransferase family 2 protein [Actinomycetota bacterium]|nr:glycosyltransferase family 2 protein [Actinomycetota bacterium]
MFEVSGAPTTPRVSVVIPTYQRRELIRTILAPLMADPAASEVVVVNDGGTDGTAYIVKQIAADDARLRLLDLPHRGRQQARRAGVEAATGDIVLFIDDDVSADPGLVTGHASAHREGLADVIEGYMPVAVPAQRKPGQAATFLYAREYEQHCAQMERDQQQTLFNLWGGNISLRRELALRTTAGDQFPASFGEDTHLGLLCHRLGLRGRFVRRLTARHLHSRTLPQFLRDAYQRGQAAVWLHHLHPDLVPAPDRSQYTAGLPAPLRPAVEHNWPIARRAVEAGATGAGRMHSYRVEEAGVKLLRRWAAHQGMVEALQALATASAGAPAADPDPTGVI